MFNNIKSWARKLKLEITAIYLAAIDARTPRVAKMLALVIAAYAISPIDLIPDFIPVLGLLDDLIIVPAGIALIVRLIPKELMASFREEARALPMPSSNWVAGIVIVVLWLTIGFVFAQWYLLS